MMKIFLLITLTLILSACVPQSGGGGAARQTASVGTNKTNTGSTSNYVNTQDLYWYGSNTNTMSLTLNSNSVLNFYLRGKKVEDFLGYKNTQNVLANFNSLYCLEVTFPGPLKTLRSRMVPMSFTDYASGKIERLFRIDIEDTTNSGYACAGSPTPATVVFDLTQICPTCATSQLATSVKLYQSLGTVMGSQVATSGASSLDLSSLTLRFDPTNNSTSTNGSCTLSSCQTQGYDCCVSGQCVIDGSIKPSSLTIAEFINIVKPSVDNQFSSFTSWPQYYNVCPRIPDPQVTPTPTATPDPNVVSAAQLNSLKNDFFCIKELEATATSTPYNLFDFSSTTFSAAPCTGTETQINTCLQTHRQNFPTAGVMCNATSTINYLEVMKRVYAMCGCGNTNWSLSMYDTAHPLNTCPYYSLKALNSLGQETAIDAQIANVQCSVGDPNPTTTPFQNLSINVSSRSAPHRFFKASDGSAVDDITTIANTANTPEGTQFSYLDPGTYTMPSNGSFNMNSILGQFNVNLSEALPAKTVTLEYDATYVISTLSGYYTPCPTCSRDSWFQTFSANPSSQYGVGLQSGGYSTMRDSYDGNTGAGNYEDTIFGRACFVPPTMIPFSHKSYSSVVTQRQSRLMTQAALFVNGYQRDWYGFNKGAVIGSFDGVKWFAIGKNRRVRATSNKLFLAINAPFADLATPSTMVVSVRQDEGIATAAGYDYDFGLSQYDARQNEAGSCQRHHLCDKDSDCISKLGWEYVCADVSAVRTTWPTFNSTANELANTSQSAPLISFLQEGSLSGSSTKRCVYRGAGSLCSTNYSVLGTGGSTDPNLRRLLSCAPNFYCASVSTNNFNSEIARFATSLENIPLSNNHLYGKDANVLGRPLHYMASGSLASTVQSGIQSSTTAWGVTQLNTYVGLCRPGRTITTTGSGGATVNVATTQNTKDSSNRTDFINQIGGCNSGGFYENGRYTNCPDIEPIDNDSLTTNDGNYRIFASTGSAQTISQVNTITQNSCGKESQKGTSPYENPFYYIESGILSSTTIVDKTLVKDACFRRAGSICHTDLDCAPNKLHEEQVDNFGLAHYGNTVAEQSYWRESLICGQAAPKPTIGSSNYNSYDMTQNRCCRAVGKDLTLYTQTSSTGSLNTNMVPSNQTNWNRTDGRYSRYLNLPGYPSSTYPKPDVSTLAAVLTGKQWKTFGTAAKNTCCGGGWIRKFADGTHTWPIGGRLNFDISSFQCLNYTYPIAYSKPSDVPSLNYSNDYGDFCQDVTSTTNTNCLQVPYAVNSGNSIISPSVYASSAGLTYIMVTKPDATFGGLATILRGYNGSWVANPTVKTEHLLFPPKLKTYTDVSTAKPVGWSNPYFPPNAYADSLSFYLPSYIYDDNTADVTIRGIAAVWLFTQDGSNFIFNNLDGLHDGNAAVTSRIRCAYNVGGGGSNCMWQYDTSTGVMTVTNDWDYYSATTNTIIMVEYYPTAIRQRSSSPGNDLYYLTKLGKFELLGVPQMHYEPLYCSTDYNTLVPNLYNVSSRTSFETSSNTIVDASNYFSLVSDTHNSAERVAKTAMINKSAVFSENEVSCCLKLGSEATSAANCCSGYVKDGYCKLPSKTDLNVYFNRFITSEGSDPTDAGGGLVDADFDDYTGEPKLTSLTKLYALGDKYCPDGVRQGAAFGAYKAQPNPTSTATTSTIYSLVDSYSDLDTEDDDERGANEFVAGFRWNHHLYCK